LIKLVAILFLLIDDGPSVRHDDESEPLTSSFFCSYFVRREEKFLVEEFGDIVGEIEFDDISVCRVVFVDEMMNEGESSRAEESPLYPPFLKGGPC
jgi:hypothetical protein